MNDEIKKEKKKKIKPILKLLIAIDVIAAICFFLFYGPFTYVRDFLITTAMTTKSHKCLARIFYSETLITEVLNSNYVSVFNEDTDASKVTVGQFSTTYSNPASSLIPPVIII